MRFSLEFESGFSDFCDYYPVLKKYKACDKESGTYDFIPKYILPYLLSSLGARGIARVLTERQSRFFLVRNKDGTSNPPEM